MKTRQASHNPFIVTSHRSLLRRILEFIFTLLFWLYGVGVSLFFIASLFGINNLYIRLLNAAFNTTFESVHYFLYKTLTLFVTILVGLFIWKVYNSRRFGKLRRRTYPQPTTYQDLLALDLVDDDTLTRLQTSDLIQFETNPIQHTKE